MKEDLIISFSGGRTSAMMTRWLLLNKQDEYNMHVVFANTGHEREATLKFVKQCDDTFGFKTQWLEAVTNPKFGKGVSSKIVNFDTAYRNVLKNGTDPFEEVIKKHGITNQDCPNCSREMKGYTIRAYMRDVLGHKKIDYFTALGIRRDEPKRLNWLKAKKQKLIYFGQLGNITSLGVNEFWSKQSFDLELKSYEGNCILCWKKSNRKLLTLISEGLKANDPELIAEIEWLKYIEKTYGRFIPNQRKEKQDKGQDVRFFRGQKSIDDLIEDAYCLDLSEFAKDESKLLKTAMQLSMWDDELDSNFGCVESCEAF